MILAPMAGGPGTPELVAAVSKRAARLAGGRPNWSSCRSKSMRTAGAPETLETGYAVDSVMAFPETPPDGTRQRLTDLRNGLLHLHKSLLDSESATYDHDIRRITSKGQLLNLVLHDPYFAWLHELSELVVLIDEILDAKEPATPADDGRLLAQARELLAPAEATSSFRKHYLEALQRDPNVVMAHAQAMKMLASLGEPKSERRTQQDETE